MPGSGVVLPRTSLVDAKQANNLPLQLTSFIGREQERALALKMLLHDGVRLLTLTGPPGIGKTRLALQVATDLLGDPSASSGQAFAGGLFFVSLASISGPSLVPFAIGQALNLTRPAHRPLLDSLKEHLRDKETLLVLDNFEQVVSAAPSITDLLTACPLLKVVVTSRQVLRVTGEQEFPVPPLQLPEQRELGNVDALSHYEAVTLFAERARASRPTFQLTGSNASAVARICVQLDGLPLAIELAAARVKLLPPQAILLHLARPLSLLTGGAKDLPARQQTLRNAIQWSHNLLGDEEKALFQCLSVFVGGWTLEAAEAVCSDFGRPEGTRTGDFGLHERVIQNRSGVLEGLALLVDKSLVKQEDTGGEPRFVMLETIREYAGEKLAESEQSDAVRKEHALYFMKLAEEAEPHLRSEQQQEWLERLEDEHDNLRTGLHWAGDGDDDQAMEIGLRMGGALWRFWALHGYLSEGRKELAKVLELSQSLNSGGGTFDLRPSTLDPYRAKALNGAGILADRQGDYISARKLHEESLAIMRELGDKKGMAASLNNLGSVAQQQGDYVSARSLYEESLALKRELGDKWSAAISLSNLGLVAQQQGDYVSARSLYEESLNLARELGDKWGVATSLNNLGLVAHLQGDYVSARSLYEESLVLKRELGDKRGVAISLSNLGLVALEQGDYASARAHFEESLALRGELGDKWGIALSLAGLGGVEVNTGESERGARVLAAVEALLEEVGTVLEKEDRLPYGSAVAAARERLGEETFTRAWSEGKGMTLAEAISYAHSLPPQPDVGMPDGVSPLRAAKLRYGGLTRRERQIATLISRGNTNSEIAEELVVTKRTVETHVTNILAKLDLKSRHQLAVWAMQNGLNEGNQLGEALRREAT